MPSIASQIKKIDTLLEQQQEELVNLKNKLKSASYSEKKNIQSQINKTSQTISKIQAIKQEYQQTSAETASLNSTLKEAKKDLKTKQQAAKAEKKEEKRTAKIYGNKKTKYKSPNRQVISAERTPEQEDLPSFPTTAEAIASGQKLTQQQLQQYNIEPQSPKQVQLNRKIATTLALSSGLLVGSASLLKLTSGASAGLFGMSAFSSAVLAGGLVGIAVGIALPVIGLIGKKVISSLKKSIARRKQRQANRIEMAIRAGYYNPSTNKEKGIGRIKSYINNKKQERAIRRNFTTAWVNCSVFNGDPAKKTLCLVGNTPDNKGHFPVISVYARGQKEIGQYKEIQAYITQKDIDTGKVGFINNKEMELDLTNSEINTVEDEDFLAKQKAKENRKHQKSTKKTTKKEQKPPVKNPPKQPHKESKKSNFYGKSTEPINDKTKTAVPLEAAESNVVATVTAHKRKAKGTKNKPIASKKNKQVQAAKPSERSAAAKKAAATRAANQRKRSAAAKKAAATRAANQKAKEAAAKKAAAARAAKLAAAKKQKAAEAKKKSQIQAPEGQAIRIAGPNGDTTIVFKVQLDAKGQVKKSEIDVNEPKKQAAKPSYVKVNGKVMAASDKSPEKVEVIKSNSETIKIAGK